MKLFGAHLVKWDVFRLKELCLKGLNAWAEAVRGCQPGPEQQVALANHWDVPVRIWRHDLHNDIDVSSSAKTALACGLPVMRFHGGHCSLYVASLGYIGR